MNYPPRLRIALATFLFPFVTQVYAEFFSPPLLKVPVDRLLKNLHAKLKQAPQDKMTMLRLARVHAQAYAQKIAIVEAIDESTPFFGRKQFEFQQPRQVAEAPNQKATQLASEHLQKAIEYYEKAHALDPHDLVLELGWGWALEKAGRKKQAIELYRNVFAKAWGKEKDSGGLMGASIAAETGSYLWPLLDPQKDTAEIEAIRKKLAQLERNFSAITPLLIPLGDEIDLEKLINSKGAVAFDLDGTGKNQYWQWPSAAAGWLVYDPQGNGEIKSGRDLIGSITFWIFWDNGYQVLDALDDNRDGILRDSEINHLKIWQDINSDGVSQSVELMTLKDRGIVALTTTYHKHATGIAYNKEGALMQNGKWKPTYDWIPGRSPRP